MIDSTLMTYATRQVGGSLLAATLVLLMALGAGLNAGPSAAEPGTVTGAARVVDGDTIEIEGARIRLEGIDAPEATQSCGRPGSGTWACGRAAMRELADLVGSRDVTCESRGVDKYGRMLGVCLAAGRNLNAEMVSRGLAWAFVRYSTTYRREEADARARGVGIWQGEAQPPWEYRQARWNAAEDIATDGCAIKGNVTANGRIYHMPWSPWYEQIRMEPDKGKRWFCSETEAVAAGWRPVQMR